VKAALLAVALAMVLMPRNRVSPIAYPLLFGVPLVYAATRRDAERAFLLWTMYSISFAGFVVLRRVADDAGMPWLHSYVIDIDRVVGLGTLPTVIFQRLWYSPAHPSSLDAVAVGFHLSYYVVPPLAAIVFWWADRGVFERYLVAISVTYLVGVLLHFAVPTVPPWMAAQSGYIEPVARVLYDRIYQASPTVYRYGNAIAGGNSVAAMPSLHMATAFLLPLATLYMRSGAVRVGICALYAAGMGFSLVYMGEHYVADLLGGMLVAWLAWRASPAILRRLLPPMPSRVVEPGAS